MKWILGFIIGCSTMQMAYGMNVLIPDLKATHSETDFVITGFRSHPFERIYLGGSGDEGFGVGWVTNFSQKLVKQADGSLELRDPSSLQVLRFLKDNSVKNSWTSKVSGDKAVKKGVQYTLSKGPEKWVFDQAGFLISRQRGRKKVAVERSGDGHIVRLSDSSGNRYHFIREKGSIKKVLDSTGKVAAYSFRKGKLSSVWKRHQPKSDYGYKKGKLESVEFPSLNKKERLRIEKGQATLKTRSDRGLKTFVLSKKKNQFVGSLTGVALETDRNELKYKSNVAFSISGQAVVSQKRSETVRPKRKIASLKGDIRYNKNGLVTHAKNRLKSVTIQYDPRENVESVVIINKTAHRKGERKVRYRLKYAVDGNIETLKIKQAGKKTRTVGLGSELSVPDRRAYYNLSATLSWVQDIK